MRVALITEGAYPYHASGASGWCHQLVSGLGRHAYRVVALTRSAGDLTPVYPLPPNVAGVTAVPVWGPAATAGGRLARRRARRAATSAAVRLCRGLLGESPHCDSPPAWLRHAPPPSSATMFRDALVRLANLAASGAHPLPGVPLADVLLDAWRAAGATPRLSLRDAESAAMLLEHALRPLAVPEPPADLCHPVSGGLPLLVALASKWRAGTPYLLTEQGIYLRERYLDYGAAWPAGVKSVMLRFFRALSQLGYVEAALVVAGTRFDQRWQLRHGAHPAKVVVVPGGVDPAAFPPQPDDPAGQTVVWLGRIEPHKDLHTLIHAFWRVHQHLPHARLRLVGPVCDQRYEVSCRALVRRLGLAGCVELAGPAPRAADAYASGQVVVRSSVCEGMPYPLVEAMMSGRATVSTDVGGVAELVGDTGVVVPPGDPAALAAELVALLRDPARRRALGEAAHRRARGYLTLDRMLRAYDEFYADAIAPLPPAVDAPIMEFSGSVARCVVPKVHDRHEVGGGVS